MKNLFVKYFGVLGYLLYYPLAIFVRIPVALFFWIWITVAMILVNPLTGCDCCPRWVDNLYDWYCGK